MSHGRAWLAFAVWVSISISLACRHAGPIGLALRPGLSLASEVKVGEARSFAFWLRRGEYVELRVSQDALDVVLTLHRPDGTRWAPIDTQTVVPAPEVLRVVAPLDGRYVLDVEAASKAASGPFRLEVVALRPATEGDRRTARAEDDLAQAEGLRRRNDEASELRALPLYEAAVRAFAQAGDRGSEGYARVQWARVLRRRNRKEEAARALRGCLALPAAALAPGTGARAATMLAEVLSDLGESAEADALDRAALAEWRKLGRPSWEALVVNDLALRAVARGELAQAEDLYRQALRSWLASGDATPAAVVLGNLASLYTLAGEPQLALDTADQALARFPEHPPAENLASVLEYRGRALADLGRGDESQRAFSQALGLRRQGEPAALAQLERHLARLAYDRGDFGEAAKRYGSALATLEAVKDRQRALATRQDLAWTELKRGHLETAEQLFDRTAAEAESSENRWVQAAVLAGRARLERARGHLQAALALACQALDRVERLRRELGRTDLRTSVFANQQSYFDLGADLTLDLYGQTGDRSLLVEAFEISERSRARRLLDLVAADRVAPSREPRGAETPAAAALRRADERLRTLRSKEGPASEIARGEREVRAAVLELRREEGAAGSAGPEFGGAPLSFRRIQRSLDRDTVLIEFHLGEDASYRWVVSRQDLAVHRLPRQRDVETVARKALGVLSAQGVSAETVQGQETLRAAARLLVGEAMPIRAPRWLVVMDGALHALPLGALPDPQNPAAPILATHEIAYAPSASVAVRLAERGRRLAGERRKDLAVFADPVYEREETASSSQVAEQAIRDPVGPLVGLRSARGGGVAGLQRLTYADTEARRILSLVPSEDRIDARRFAASKARVLSGELGDYRRLHFAVHGLPNENHPELSALALSLFDREGRPQDGILFAHEVARLRLHADLAVLSACESGRGAAVSGEGLVGLVHAFFTAGTARVVATEWAVNDQATAELMALFYEGVLRRHLDPARALQQAQLALTREGPWRRPYFWAGFVVQGGF